jgi:SAM-dependent methyltransferase
MTAAVSAAAETRPMAAYDVGAPAYDRRTAAFQRYRQRILDALILEPGDVVLDVGCGTGLCFAGLENKIGPSGRIVGIDESPAMLALARERVTAAGWDNVTLIEARVEHADLAVTANAALFCAVHDILQSSVALQKVFDHLKPGAQVVAGGGKFTTLMGLNLQVVALHQPYIRSFDGFRRPWGCLEGFVTQLDVAEFAYGTGYVAIGRTPGQTDTLQRVPEQQPAQAFE